MHSVKLDGGNISKSVARVYCAPAVVFLGPIQNFVLNGAESGEDLDGETGSHA